MDRQQPDCPTRGGGKVRTRRLSNPRRPYDRHTTAPRKHKREDQDDVGLFAIIKNAFGKPLSWLVGSPRRTDGEPASNEATEQEAMAACADGAVSRSDSEGTPDESRRSLRRRPTKETLYAQKSVGVRSRKTLVVRNSGMTSEVEDAEKTEHERMLERAATIPLPIQGLRDDSVKVLMPQGAEGDITMVSPIVPRNPSTPLYAQVPQPVYKATNIPTTQSPFVSRKRTLPRSPPHGMGSSGKRSTNGTRVSGYDFIAPAGESFATFGSRGEPPGKRRQFDHGQAEDRGRLLDVDMGMSPNDGICEEFNTATAERIMYSLRTGRTPLTEARKLPSAMYARKAYPSSVRSRLLGRVEDADDSPTSSARSRKAPFGRGKAAYSPYIKLPREGKPKDAETQTNADSQPLPNAMQETERAVVKAPKKIPSILSRIGDTTGREPSPDVMGTGQAGVDKGKGKATDDLFMDVAGTSAKTVSFNLPVEPSTALLPPSSPGGSGAPEPAQSGPAGFDPKAPSKRVSLKAKLAPRAVPSARQRREGKRTFSAREEDLEEDEEEIQRNEELRAVPPPPLVFTSPMLLPPAPKATLVTPFVNSFPAAENSAISAIVNIEPITSASACVASASEGTAASIVLSPKIPAIEKHAAEKPVTANPVNENPATEKPATANPATANPATETFAAEKPAVPVIAKNTPITSATAGVVSAAEDMATSTVVSPEIPAAEKPGIPAIVKITSTTSATTGVASAAENITTGIVASPQMPAAEKPAIPMIPKITPMAFGTSFGSTVTTPSLGLTAVTPTFRVPEPAGSAAPPATTAPATTGFSFGQSASETAPSPSFSFAATQPSTISTGNEFGCLSGPANSTASTSTLPFGQPSSSAPSGSSLAPFGQQASSSAFSFGSAGASSGFGSTVGVTSGFGAAPAAVPSPFGSTTHGGHSFPSVPPAAPPAPLVNFGHAGNINAATTPFNFNFAGGGQQDSSGGGESGFFNQSQQPPAQMTFQFGPQPPQQPSPLGGTGVFMFGASGSGTPSATGAVGFNIGAGGSRPERKIAKPITRRKR